MKLLFEKKRDILSIFLTISMVFGILMSGYADITPVKDRTPQIRDAIVAAVPGVSSADDVTAAHLAAITTLEASKKSISALKAGDFDGLTALTTLDLTHNTITDISTLANLTSLTMLDMAQNAISDISALKKLTALTTLNLNHNAIKDISVLKNLTKLRWLFLSYNSISDISALKNLTALKHLWLGGNAIEDISALEKLTKLKKLWLSRNAISDVSVLEKLTPLTALWLDGNAISDVSALEGLISLVNLNLSGNPISDLAPLRRLKAANPDMAIDITLNDDNNAPVFTDGTSTTRSIAENTAPSVNIGTAIAATDADTGDTLTYTLGGTDAASFSIVSTSGQLQTSAALDYETKTSYSVSVSVSDGNGGSDSIAVTINVTDVDETPANRAPVFTDGTSTTRSIAENTDSGTNIGSAVAATDADNHTLTYTLGGTDASSFSIVSTSGQLQTNTALNYESKSSYSVSVSVSDNNGGSDSIDVTISITDVNEAPSFASTTATRSIAENTASGEDIGAAVAATDVDGDTLSYTLGGTDAASFNIVSTSGQLQTSAALDYETKNSYSVTVTAADGTGEGSLSASIPVTITLTDVNDAPVFTAGDSTTRTIAENSVANTNIGTTVAATDQDKKPDPENPAQLIAKDTITYSIPTTGDAAAFSIDSNTGQLKTKNALNYEVKNSYTVVVTASDGNLTDTITVTISVTNVNEAPAFATGTTISSISATKGTAITSVTLPEATDVDANTTLTYTVTPTLPAGLTFTPSTRILSGTPTAVSDSATYTYTASDSNLSATLTFSIQVSAPANNPPVFTDGTSTTRSVAENTASGQDIGTAVSATDADNDTLTYTLGGTDAASFSIVSNTGQLQTSVALDRETKASYSVTITADDGNTANNTDSIDVTINVTNVNEKPTFDISGRVTLSVAENTAANTNIGDAFQATDPDSGDTVTYSLQRADKDSFSIDASTGQLKTRVALDYETKNSYSDLAVRATDSDGLVSSVLVTVSVTNANEAPAFSAGASISNISATAGTAITSVVLPEATDVDAGNTITYTVTPALPAGLSFIASTRTLSGTPTTETASVTYTYTASDGTLSSTLTFSIQVGATPNNAPTFTDGTSTTRSIAENSDSDTDIGSAVAATDTDDDTLTYTLGGTDASSFSIVGTSGQLQTSAALNYESKSSYSVSVSVSDNNGGSDSIDVTINVTNVNEAPSFASTTAARSIAENTVSGQNIGSAVSATDVDANTTLTYTLGGDDAASFSIISTSGQLQTSAALDYETKNAYSVTVTAADGTGEGSLSTSIPVTISVTDANDAPVFTAGDSTTRTIAENSVANTNIGTTVTATDQDKKPDPANPGQFIAKDTITYSIPTAGDAAAFSIDSNTGQLKTKDALNYESDNSYTVVVTASDGSLTDTITVTISVTNVNEAPAFATGASISDISATNGTAITSVTLPAATDPDANTTLTYTVTPTLPAGLTFTASTRILSGTPTAVSASATYTYTAIDSNLSDTLTFSIQVSAANSAPVFTDGTTTTRSVAENTAAEQNIGTAVAATDANNDTLTYTLGGTDAASFSIVNTTGQLQTNAALNYESKSSYSVSVSVSYNNGGSDSIAVTINVTNVNEAPSFANSTATRSIAENTVSGQNIGSAVSATDVDANTTLTYTLGGTDAASFSIVSTSGQLQTSAALDYETKNSYSVTVTAADGTGDGSLSASIPVTITLTDANDAPVFTDGGSTTRTIAENSVANTNIGTTVTATDQDKKPDPENPAQLIAKDAITYSIPTTGDAAAFSIDSNTGQLKTKNALNYENDNSYTVVVTASDGNLTDTITVTISVTNVNEAPAFATGATISGISATKGTAITSVTLPEATDVDANTTLTYTVTPTLPAGLTFTASTRILSGTPTAVSDSATYTYTASDSNLSATLTFTIQVSAPANNPPANNAPTFTDGTSTTRSVAENTRSGTNIGTAVAATDTDNDTLTYTLGGTDASSFSIVSTSGQLQTSAALDRETKASYSVTITADDGNTTNNTDTIDVTISVTNVNEKPIFSSSDRVTLSVAENTAANTNIGDAFQATDPDSGDTVTYSLQRADKTSFRIDANTGQLKTHAALDYETKNSYSNLAVRATDSGGLVSSVLVTVNVTNVNDNSPVFTEGASTTRSIAENTPSDTNIGSPVAATDADNDTLGYTLGGTNAALFYIISASGQLRTYSSLDYETKSSYSVTVNVSDGNGRSDSIAVTINVTDVDESNSAPVFTDGTSTTRTIAENIALGTYVGSAVAATVANNATLTYTLSGVDAASFAIDRVTGQLRTNAAIDYEVKSSYTVTVSVSGSNGGSDSITVTINVTDETETSISPPLSQRTAQVRTAIVAAAPGVSRVADVTVAHLAAITSLDLNNRRITALQAGDFNGLTGMTNLNLSFNSISDISTLSGLTQLTVLDLNSNSISDISALSGLTSMTNLHLSFNSISDISALSGLTSMTVLSLDNNSLSDISALSGMPRIISLDLRKSHVGDISALSGMTLMETLDLWGNNITDVSPLSGMSLLFHLNIAWNPISDYAPLRTLKAAKPSLIIDINLNNNPPAFTEGTSATRSVAERTASGTNIGNPVAATDADNHTLRYDLGGTDAASFSIVSTSGQLQTNAALDYETKASYAVTVSIFDGNHGGDSISVTINVTDVVDHAPVFTEGASTTRSVAERTASGTNIGTPVAATDADNDTLAYTLGGTDASSFSIVSTSGQLQTSAALDYETTSSYSVTVNVSDSYGESDSIDVTINVTDVVDHVPVFTEGTSTTRSVAERTASSTNIGNPVAATDADNDTLTYTLGGTDAAAFSIVSTSGQLQTSAALDYETTSSYSVTVNVNDGYGGSDSIDVTINVTDVVDPVFTDGSSTTRSVAENTVSGTNIGTAIAATHANNDTLTYTLGGTDAASFSIVSTSGQLQTNAALDYETKASYAVTVSASDQNNVGDSISVTINVTDANDPPAFTDGSSTIRYVAADAASGVNIGDAIVATDPDTGDTLAYTLSGTDAASFSIVGTSGQLQTSAALDEDTESYSVTVSVSDGNGGSDIITVTISTGTPITPVKDRTTQVRDAIVAAVSGVSNADDVTTAHLAAITELNLASKSITALKAGDFSGLTGMGTLHLNDNSISDISALSGSTQLTRLYLYNNSIRDISALSGMTSMRFLYLQNNSISDISALSGMTSTDDLRLDNNSISDISALSGMTSMDILYMTNNNVTDVSPLSGMTLLAILSVAGNPISDYATIRTLKASNGFFILDISLNNNPPTFTDGATTTRSVAENTAAGQNIGAAVAATDADNHTLSYTLGGTDADSFSIVSTSGQLQTKAALDYETKSSYTVTVTVYDGNNGGDRITVTINVTDVAAAAPVVLTPPAPVLPNTTELLTNFPNPFNPETWIPYQLAKPAEVMLTIYDIQGRVVRTLRLGHQPAGFYQNRSKAAHWDGRNHLGEKVATGVYFYTLKAGDYTATRKLLIRK